MPAMRVLLPGRHRHPPQAGRLGDVEDVEARLGLQGREIEVTRWCRWAWRRVHRPSGRAAAKDLWWCFFHGYGGVGEVELEAF